MVRLYSAAGNRTGVRILLAAVLATLLTACGGGDPEDDGHVPTPGVDCQARPDLCK